MYPIVPGHESVGTVTEVGAGVTKVQPGDDVAVGCIRDSCLGCQPCSDGNENYCDNGFVHTYNSLKLKVPNPSFMILIILKIWLEVNIVVVKMDTK